MVDCYYCGKVFSGDYYRWLCPECGAKNACCEGADVESSCLCCEGADVQNSCPCCEGADVPEPVAA